MAGGGRLILDRHKVRSHFLLALSCYITILDGMPTHMGHNALCSHVHWGGLLEPARPWNMRHPFTLRSETVVERMLSNWMSICLYQYLKVSSALEPGVGESVPSLLTLG